MPPTLLSRKSRGHGPLATWGKGWCVAKAYTAIIALGVSRLPMDTSRFHEAITRLAAWSLSFAGTALGQDWWQPENLALLAITVYFANNFCNALFGRAVSFPITVRPDDVENYELARVHSGGYSLVLWSMLVVGARMYGS